MNTGGAIYDIKEGLIARREKELARIAQECGTSTAVLETFLDGGRDPPDDVLIRVAEYLWQGLKRYHPETDTLVSTRATVMPTPVVPDRVSTLQVDYSQQQKPLMHIREALNGAKSEGRRYSGTST